MTGSRGPAVQMSLRRRQRGEDRIEAADDITLPSDHQTVAALQTPDAAAHDGVDVVNASGLKRLRAADVVDGV